jgi:hypothetical protein
MPGFGYKSNTLAFHQISRVFFYFKLFFFSIFVSIYCFHILILKINIKKLKNIILIYF